MRTILAVIAALAVVTFPVFFVVFMFKSLVLGIMAGVLSAIWLFGQVIIKLIILGKRERSTTTKLLKR